MRTLILMRHAKAVRAQEAPSDEARALTERGKRDAEAAGAALKAAGLAPDLALVSTAVRTRETAAHVLKQMSAEARFDAGLFHAGPESIWDAFTEAEAARVMIIGHNPGMAELTAMLIGQAHDRSHAARDAAGNFPTSAWAAFEIGGDQLEVAGPRFLGAWRPERE